MLLMITNLLKNIEYIYQKKLFVVYLLFFILIILLSSIYGYTYLQKFPNQFDSNDQLILKNLPFGYGLLVESLFHEGKYQQEWYGVQSYLVRFPLLPLLVTGLLKISQNFYFIVITKNIIFFTIFFFTSHYSLRSLKKSYITFLSLLSLILYNYYNLIVIMAFVYTDGIIAILLPCIFLILISRINKNSIFLSIFLFLLFFTKTTMFYLIFVISILFFFLNKKKSNTLRLLPLFTVIISSLIWGSFGYVKTGKFPFGSDISSTNQEALHVVFNKDFHKYYPNRSVDLISKIQSKEKLENEWKYHEFYKKINSEYFAHNKKRIMKDVLIKIEFILFNYRKDAVHPDDNGNYENPIMFSHIINRLIFITSLLYLLKNIFMGIKNSKVNNIDYYFFFIVCFSLLPHLVGWATSKHLVPIFLISHIYLLLNIDYFKNR
jgi:hypothetical protein